MPRMFHVEQSGLALILVLALSTCLMVPLAHARVTGEVYAEVCPRERQERDLRSWRDEQRRREVEKEHLEQSRQRELVEELRRLERLQRLNEFRQRFLGPRRWGEE